VIFSAGFYANQTGDAIVAALQQRDGVLTAEDLAAHRTAFVEPVSTTYRGHRVYEVPPPTQVGGSSCQSACWACPASLCGADAIASTDWCHEEPPASHAGAVGSWPAPA
jgi:Gamma-glutamyltranspeptidase